MMNFHPANFRSQVRSRHATDRQTDRQTLPIISLCSLRADVGSTVLVHRPQIQFNRFTERPGWATTTPNRTSGTSRSQLEYAEERKKTSAQDQLGRLLQRSSSRREGGLLLFSKPTLALCISGLGIWSF